MYALANEPIIDDQLQPFARHISQSNCLPPLQCRFRLISPPIIMENCRESFNEKKNARRKISSPCFSQGRCTNYNKRNFLSSLNDISATYQSDNSVGGLEQSEAPIAPFIQWDSFKCLSCSCSRRSSSFCEDTGYDGSNRSLVSVFRERKSLLLSTQALSRGRYDRYKSFFLFLMYHF